jgi:8-oxo-dGTP pyrophosphatase MutT (NUDIX family)
MSVVSNRLHKLALEIFGRLPGRVRRVVVQLLTPHYVLGAVLVLRHEDNVLFVRSRHTRAGWTLPGGLMQRGETPADAVRREVGEELGLDLEVDEQPTLTLVDPACRRVDLVYEVPVAVPPAIRVDGTEAVAACWLPTDTELEDPTAIGAIGALLRRDAPVEVVLPERPQVAAASDGAR